MKFSSFGIAKIFLLLGSPSRCAPLQYKIKEKYSQAQQYIFQLYKCHRMLVFMQHVSTHSPSHPQVLHNLKDNHSQIS
jgi:hypothetical protein